MIIDQQTYIEHYGVQGMKWGQKRASNKASVSKFQSQGLSKRTAKRTTRVQNRIDAQRTVANGQRTKSGKSVSNYQKLVNRGISNQSLGVKAILKHPLSTKKAAIYQLQRNQKSQKSILSGKHKVTASLIKLQGVSLKDLDFAV